MAVTFVEEIDDTNPPSRAGFALEGGKATGTYLLGGVGDTDGLVAAINTIVGKTDIAGMGDGRLKRTPPKAHPQYPWLFASSISTIVGVGKGVQTATQTALEVPTLPFYYLYNDYRLTVEFTPRPWPVLQDASILRLAGTWYKDDGSAQGFAYSGEWLRYCDFDLTPQFEYLTFQQGQMAFRSTGTANGKPFQGMPRLPLPNQTLVVKWFGVPYRYITSANSYITGGTASRGSWIGRINQNPWWLWPAGSLLYLNYKVQKYTPPVQETSAIYPGVISSDKLCNIEFHFLYTSRTASDVPGGVFPNANYIAAGHNLLPWAKDRKFHYATTKTPAFVPSFLSFPAELLFMDPDVANNGV